MSVNISITSHLVLPTKARYYTWINSWIKCLLLMSSYFHKLVKYCGIWWIFHLSTDSSLPSCHGELMWSCWWTEPLVFMRFGIRSNPQCLCSFNTLLTEINQGGNQLMLFCVTSVYLSVQASDKTRMLMMAGFTPWSFKFITHHAVICIKSGLNSVTGCLITRFLHVLLFIWHVWIMFHVAKLLFYVLCVTKDFFFNVYHSIY